MGAHHAKGAVILAAGDGEKRVSGAMAESGLVVGTWQRSGGEGVFEGRSVGDEGVVLASGGGQRTR